MYGNPETTPGGRALKFYSSVRLDVRRIEQLKVAGQVVGNRTRVKVVKNKVAPPFREAEFDIMYGQGISREGEILDIAVKLDIIEKSGSWFSYNGQKIGQGRDNVREFLRANPELGEEIAQKVMENAGKLMENQRLKKPAPAARTAAPAPEAPEAPKPEAPRSTANIDIEVDD